MKRCDKYPSASEEDIKNLPKQMRVLGLHPLIWVVIVVLLIAAGRTCETVEDLGCGWDFWEVEDDHESDDKGDHEGDDESQSDYEPLARPQSEMKSDEKDDEED